MFTSNISGANEFGVLLFDCIELAFQFVLFVSDAINIFFYGVNFYRKIVDVSLTFANTTFKDSNFINTALLRLFCLFQFFHRLRETSSKTTQENKAKT